MKIKYKIALYYTLSAAALLVIFAIFVYYFSSKTRRDEYQSRLEYRANAIGAVIIENDSIQINLLRKLDKSAFKDLYNETILVYDDRKYDLLYTNMADTTVRTPKALLDYIKTNRKHVYRDDKGETVGLYYTEGNVSVLVMVSSFDFYGFQNLQHLENILITELLAALIVLVGIGYFFARKMVQPIDRLVEQADKINANNLQDQRVVVKGKDEIAKLGTNFNTMLQRLSHSFDLQKSFVSNASHELRTPLAAIISQLQVTMAKRRTGEEYEAVMQSVLEDAEGLSDLTNGLLQLAQSEMNDQEFVFTPVRMDELLLETGDLIRLKRKAQSKIDIQFIKVPEQDTFVTCNGNESLLKVLFINLFDNACKFSDNDTAEVSIDFDNANIIVHVHNNGGSIPSDELDKIFEPFFRGRNSQQVRGHGLGLSICRRIVQLHGGQISADSSPEMGTVISVQLPHV